MNGINDHLRSMALTWYIADIATHFSDFDNDTIKALAQELSETSLRTPIWYIFKCPVPIANLTKL